MQYLSYQGMRAYVTVIYLQDEELITKEKIISYMRDVISIEVEVC